MSSTVTTANDPRWSNCLRMIANNLSRQQFDTWFAPVSYVGFDEDECTLTLSVPSPFIREYIEEHYLKLLRAVLQQQYGIGIRLRYEVKIDTINNISAREEATDSAVLTDVVAPRTDANASPRVLQHLDSQLKADYTFESFVEGESNKLPRTVGLAIAQNPHQATFNPLFIYGGSGVGKTHLVNAIGLRVKELHPELRVLYVSAHLFQVQYTDSVRHNTVNDFIAFYQSIDVLIIDDIQELASMQKTQLSFFHIFNHLHQNGRQLILTSDRPPVALEGMEERLLTRFKWGLLAEIERPTQKLRRDILCYKIRRDGLRVATPVVDYIAANVDNSIRDLEGVLTSLMAYSVVNNCEIDMAMAQRVVGRVVGQSRQAKAITLDDILARTCDFFSIASADVLSASRKAPVVLARQVVMYLAHQHTHLSTTKIGAYVGKRGHATVIHSCHTVSQRMAADEAFREQIGQLEQLLTLA